MDSERLQAEAYRGIRAEIESFDKRGYTDFEGLVIEIRDRIDDCDAEVADKKE